MMKEECKKVPEELQGLDAFSKLLDSKFRIPGTNITFGLDFLVGLVPFGGDIFSFLFSAGLVLTMARHGVSGRVVGKMLWNIVLDTTVGSVPVAGDIFDLFYKANRRNYKLLEEHYGEGAYQGSIWRVVIPVVIILIILFFLMLYIVIHVAKYLWEWIAAMI